MAAAARTTSNIEPINELDLEVNFVKRITQADADNIKALAAAASQDVDVWVSGIAQQAIEQALAQNGVTFA